MDIVSESKRSAIMRAVGRKDTKPEWRLRKALHALGYRYRLNARSLPGSPDLLFPRRKAVIFVHGCFWHGHHCRGGRAPSTRTEYWLPKIAANRARDARKQAELESIGYRVLTIWECELRDLNGALAKARSFLG